MADSCRRIPVIGLIGGIGSGKSFLARELQKLRRVVIIDGDAAGHEALEVPAVRQAIREKFGARVFDESGAIDRRQMGRLVFGTSAAAREARRDLEAIVHPRITENLKEQITRAQAQADIELVILDAAVMIEAGWKRLCDHVIYVDAPEDQRLARVVSSRGWKLADLRAREDSQLALDKKRKEAHDVVDNSRDAAYALSQLATLVARIVPPRPA